MTTVLVVDDEPAVLDTLTACCDNAGYEPIASLDGKDALRLFFQHHPDLVIADIMMPGLNGFELCKRIREVSEVPIIVLSALGAEREKVQGLQAGADDYIVKPVGMAELVARMEGVIRRAQLPPSESTSVYSDGAISIYMDRQEAYVYGKRVDLTPKELAMLAYLTQKARKVVSVAELLSRVWGSPHYSEDSVKWHIASLLTKQCGQPRA
jgi:DNA-binding response OmpR family regulator